MKTNSKFDIKLSLVSSAPLHEQYANDAVRYALKLSRITAIARYKAMTASDTERIKAEYAKAMEAVESCTDAIKKWIESGTWTETDSD